LTNALKAARSATTNSPKFGFGWARVAELEFSFGRTSEALTALNKSLDLTPRNAEGLALKGFLLSAQNKISEAMTYFERAMAIDGALGNAWLGRGLCRIRKGKAEPVARICWSPRPWNHSGPCCEVTWARPSATKETVVGRPKNFNWRKKLDEKDPTAWLYSALLNQQNNRINEGSGIWKSRRN
jgi:tetratricopeptide (TPR) repeat protein